MKRLLLVLPLSLIATLMLFSFMVWMVGIEKQSQPKPESVVRFDMFMLEGETQAHRHTRKLPEPPKTPDTAPREKVLTTARIESEPLAVALPDLPAFAMDFSVNGLPVSAPALSSESMLSRAQSVSIGQNQDAMLLHRVDGRYPPRAEQRRIEGYVVLSFTIDKHGVPKDIEVIESHPNRIFDREARRALRKWKYQPRIVNGVAQEVVGHQAKIEFRMQP